MELIIDSKKIKKHKLILILVYTTQPCSCCFYCLLLDYISPDMQRSSYRAIQLLGPDLSRVQVQKAKVEVPSIEVVAQIMEELNYKSLGSTGKIRGEDI